LTDEIVAVNIITHFSRGIKQKIACLWLTV